MPEVYIEIGGSRWTLEEAKMFLLDPPSEHRDLHSVLMGVLRRLRRDHPGDALDVSRKILAPDRDNSFYIQRFLNICADIISVNAKQNA